MLLAEGLDRSLLDNYCRCCVRFRCICTGPPHCEHLPATDSSFGCALARQVELVRLVLGVAALGTRDAHRDHYGKVIVHVGLMGRATRVRAPVNKSRRSTYPLRLPRSIKAEVERRAKADGISVNQFVATAVPEKLTVMKSGGVLRRAPLAREFRGVRPVSRCDQRWIRARFSAETSLEHPN